MRTSALRVPRKELAARFTRPTRFLLSGNGDHTVLFDLLAGAARDLAIEAALKIVMLLELLAGLETFAQAAVRDLLLFGTREDHALGLLRRMRTPLTFLSIFITL